MSDAQRVRAERQRMPRSPSANDIADAHASSVAPAGNGSAENARRGGDAIRAFQRAERRAKTPPVSFSDKALQPLEVAQLRAEAAALLEPGPIVVGAGEAIPALNDGDVDGRRDAMVDTLERPTTVSVAASEHRLELLERIELLQPGVDTAQTAQASNSIEKMLCHQLAALHSAAMNLLVDVQRSARPAAMNQPAAEVAKLANSAARLMAVFMTGCEVLHKLQRRGTQRVIVQHQQVVVAPDGQMLIVNNPARRRKRGASVAKGRTPKNGK